MSETLKEKSLRSIQALSLSQKLSFKTLYIGQKL